MAPDRFAGGADVDGREPQREAEGGSRHLFTILRWVGRGFMIGAFSALTAVPALASRKFEIAALPRQSEAGGI